MLHFVQFLVPLWQWQLMSFIHQNLYTCLVALLAFLWPFWWLVCLVQVGSSTCTRQKRQQDYSQGMKKATIPNKYWWDCQFGHATKKMLLVSANIFQPTGHSSSITLWLPAHLQSIITNPNEAKAMLNSRYWNPCKQGLKSRREREDRV